MMKVRLALGAMVVGGGTLLIPGVMGVAHADTCTQAAYCTTPPSGFVGGQTQPSVEGTGGTAPAPVVQAAAAPAASLPFTGGDVAGLTVIGAGLVGAGVVLVRRTRSRSAA
jgi:hypothetical protein